MAAGDIVWLNAARSLDYMTTAGFAGTDQIYLGLTTSTPTATDAVPSFKSGGTTNYAEVTPGGNYAADGELLDTWANMWDDATAGGTGTFDDTGASVTWTQNASNPSNARWAIIYNNTVTSNAAVAYVDLGATIDMTAGDLTITWNASGIATLTAA
jgi:hypothetical protein